MARLPFELTVDTSAGQERLLAQAVIDASGTWGQPNPLGAGGVLAVGEQQAQDRIWYGIPDVLGKDRDRYAGNGWWLSDQGIQHKMR